MGTITQVRSVELEDAVALESLFVVLGYPTPPSAIRERLNRLQSDSSYSAWVAVNGESVVGFAAGHILHPVEHDRPAAQLIALMTAPDYEGRGAGTALCGTFEAWARYKGAIRALVNSSYHRTEAHRFYERRGFERTGLRFKKALGPADGAIEAPTSCTPGTSHRPRVPRRRRPRHIEKTTWLTFVSRTVVDHAPNIR